MLLLLACGDPFVATWNVETMTDGDETYDFPVTFEEPTFGVSGSVEARLVIEKGLEGTLETHATVSAFGFTQTEVEEEDLIIEKLGHKQYRITAADPDEPDTDGSDTDTDDTDGDTDLAAPAAPEDAVCTVKGDDATCESSDPDSDPWSATLKRIANKDL